MKNTALGRSIKIVIAEDNPSSRMGLIHSLKAHTQFEIIGEACNGEEAIQQASKLQPDLVIMDIEMPLMDGITAVQRIKARFPHIKVIMLTSSTCTDRVYASLIAGADGYCLKEMSTASFTEVIMAVLQDEVWLDPAFARIIAQLLAKNRSDHHESLN